MEYIKKQSILKTILLGVMWALIMSLVLILILAFVLRFLGMSEKVLIAIVQTIKGISVLFGVFMAMKKSKSMGIVNGLLIGLTFTIVSFVVFSMLDGFNFEFSNTILYDLVLCSIIGGIGGIIAVNIKK